MKRLRTTGHRQETRFRTAELLLWVVSANSIWAVPNGSVLILQSFCSTAIYSKMEWHKTKQTDHITVGRMVYRREWNETLYCHILHAIVNSFVTTQVCIYISKEDHTSHRASFLTRLRRNGVIKQRCVDVPPKQQWAVAVASDTYTKQLGDGSDWSLYCWPPCCSAERPCESCARELCTSEMVRKKLWRYPRKANS